MSGKINKKIVVLAVLGMLFFVALSSSAATVDGVSDSSVVTSVARWLINLFVTNNNNATITNNVTSGSNTGGNAFVSADDQSGTSLTTGDAQSASLVDNAANNNMISEEYESADGADDTITDVQDESTASTDLEDNLDNKVENNNDVVVENNVDASADSGNNFVQSGDSLKDARSLTGNADSVTGVNNIFNFNIHEIIRRIRSVVTP